MQRREPRYVAIFCMILISLILLVAACTKPAHQAKKPKENKIAHSIAISGVWGVYPLISQLAFEYNRIFPNIRINVIPGSSTKGMSDMMFQMVDMGMYSKSINDSRWDTNMLHIALAKDAILPVVNAANPYLVKLTLSGLTQQQLKYIFVDASLDQWGQLTGEDSSHRIRVFTRTDLSGAGDTWSSFLGTDQVNLSGTGVYGEPGMIMAVRNDVFGIGYASLRYIFDVQTAKPLDGLAALPIDLDKNGKMDTYEDYFDNLTDITHAIRHNSLPSPPARILYLIIDKTPVNTFAIDFIQWIFENGQKTIEDAGYIKLDETLFTNELNTIQKYKITQ